MESNTKFLNSFEKEQDIKFYKAFREEVNRLWDELIFSNYVCKHEECPYQDCMYHRHSTKMTYFADEDIPFYMPRSTEEMHSCMSYLDI